MRTSPPKKKSKQEDGDKALTGPRRFNGDVRDVATQAASLGVKERMLRSQVARGLIPHRRLGGRIIFLADEVSAFLRALPGVSAEQALANVAARTSGETAR
jgi:hypothetical protein